MKVLAIVGSPRKANTYRLVKAMCDALEERNVGTDLILLQDMDIQHCNGCSDHCDRKRECRVEDDMRRLYPKLRETDALIIGTPVYFWNVSGLLKTFIDRTLPLYTSRELKGKIGAAVAVSEADGQNLAISDISSFFRLHQMRDIGSIGIARGSEDVKDEDIEMAKALARKILNELA
mgnify:FL=1